MNLTFGVPPMRTKKEEKYPDNAVVTIKATGKGLAKKFEFNDKACSDLSFEEESKVSVSYTDEKVYLVNTSGSEEEGYAITKTPPRSFSNAKVYNYACGFLRLDDSIDNEFELTRVDGADYNGRPVFELSPMNVADTPKVVSESDVDFNESNESEEVQPVDSPSESGSGDDESNTESEPESVPEAEQTTSA